MKTKYLSPDERPEHDALMLQAGYDPHTGKAYPTWQIKENLDQLTRDAVQAGRRSFEYIREDATRDGLLAHWNAWNRERNSIRARVNNQEVRASGSRGTVQRDDDGRAVHQRLTWIQMSWEEVLEQGQGAATRIAAEQITRSIVAKLTELRDRVPDSTGPADAAERMGTTVEAWLAGESLVA